MASIDEAVEDCGASALELLSIARGADGAPEGGLGGREGGIGDGGLRGRPGTSPGSSGESLGLTGVEVGVMWIGERVPASTTTDWPKPGAMRSISS